MGEKGYKFGLLRHQKIGIGNIRYYVEPKEYLSMIGQLDRPINVNKSGSDVVILKKLSDASSEGLDQLMRSLDSGLGGLTNEQVERKRKQYGPNVVVTSGTPPWYIQLFHCFINPFNLVLLALSIISLVTGDMASVAIMSTMVLISVFIRFVQEYRSAREAEKLKSLVQITTSVIRIDGDGKQFVKEIPVTQLVPGDVITLSAGDMIPADIRLISARDLFISQSMLTGESLPVEKNDLQGEKGKGAFEQPNLCFIGTSVMTGTAKAVVITTGSETYFGSLAQSITSSHPPTAFDIGINKISWVLIRFIFAMAPVVFFINGFTKGDWFEALMFAVSVAVGLTPEMLPMIVTANLAKGANRMAKEKVVVKRLNSIHNLGAMSVLCTDKTGTLTQNKIILHNHLNVVGEEDTDVLKYAYLNSINQTGLKNLLDVAVVEEAENNYRTKGFFETIEPYKKIDELPFDFVRRRMSVIVKDGKGEDVLICKGALEEVLSICTKAEMPDGTLVPLTNTLIDSIKKIELSYNEDGFRVLLLAYRKLEQAQTAYKKEDEADLVVKGLLTFLDPPKESAGRAIKLLLQHGVKIKVITGDNAVVTRKICTEVGIHPEPILLGDDIEKMSDEELTSSAKDAMVFAKVSPLQKSRIIRALKAGGDVVGFLGDGVNDASGLHDADVGISVDTAVDIAKESADIILLEKSLMVLDEGVTEGRKTFINIIKYLKMALSSNFGNVFSVIGASIILPFLPMLPLQLLIQNLLYDMSQLAIPFDTVDKEQLEKPRNWRASDLVRFMFFVGPISSIFDYITFGALWFYFDANSLGMQNFFQTGWFVEGLITQTLIIHMIRTQKIPFIQETASLPLLLSTFSIVAIGVWLPFSPLATALGMVPLPTSYLIFLVSVMVGYWGLVSLLKHWYIKRFGSWL